MNQSFLFETDPEPVATVPGYPSVFSADRVYRMELFTGYAKMNEPLKGANPTAALTRTKPVKEVSIMAASQPNCALPPFPECPGVQFAVIPDWPGYAASDDGSVWSCKGRGSHAGMFTASWRKMNACIDKDGYLVVGMSNRTRKRQGRIAALVLEAFVGPRPSGHEACHYSDRTRTNNALNNLCWGTRKENCEHMQEHGTVQRGSVNARSKLTEETVKELRAIREDLGLPYEEIAQMVGLTASAVQRAIRGESWRHVE